MSHFKSHLKLLNLYSKSLETMNENKWRELGIKERSAIISAYIAFLLGWGLTIAGFIVSPVGEVADSVLWILGQSLIYTASVFGLASYFTAESRQMKRDMNEMMDRMKREIEDEQYKDNSTHQ